MQEIIQFRVIVTEEDVAKAIISEPEDTSLVFLLLLSFELDFEVSDEELKRVCPIIFQTLS